MPAAWFHSTVSAFSWSAFANRDTSNFPSFQKKVLKLETILEKNVPEKYTLSDHLWQYLQDYAKKHQAAGNGFGFGIGHRQGHHTNTKRALPQRRIGDSYFSGSGKNPRRLTPRECARLMGYPDSLKIPVSDTQAYRQFGNSVVVPVVERIAKAVTESLKHDVNHTPDLRIG